MGYAAVKDVRQGKVFELELDRVTKKEAEALVAEVAHKVLANPIIEKYAWEFIKSPAGK
jgi:phosphoribosylformylglycinamidine synthase PurS subunit